MKAVHNLQEKRFITPLLEVTTASILENPFDKYLTEEHGQAGGSFQQFLEICNREVIKYAQNK